MATQLQDIIAKRAELQKTNPNATNVDARKALETQTPATTTVAPVVNTAPISPTTSINQAQREANIANRQANPVAPVTTPVEQVTPIPVPAQSTTPNGSTINAT
jgi:hypothetical protein